MENKTMILIAVLITAVVCIGGSYAVFGTEKSNTTIYVAGSTTVEPLMVAFQEEYEKHTNVTLNVTAQGSGTAAPALRNGTAQIGMLSRNVNSSESDLRPIPIAGDGVVVIVDKNSGVTNLTLEQLAKIYYGDYTNWNQVGGNNLLISPLTREDGSGTRTCIDDFMAGALGVNVSTLSAKYAYPVHTSAQSVMDHAKVVPGAIGYVNLGSMSTLHSSLQVVTINGVMPSLDSVFSNTYGLSRSLLLAVVGQPSDDVSVFINWILSPAGQKIVENEDFVPIGPTSWSW